MTEQQMVDLDELFEKYESKIGSDLHKPIVGIYEDCDQRNSLLMMIDKLSEACKESEGFHHNFFLDLKDGSIAMCNIIDSIPENEITKYEREYLYQKINYSVLLTLGGFNADELKTMFKYQTIEVCLKYGGPITFATFILLCILDVPTFPYIILATSFTFLVTVAIPYFILIRRSHTNIDFIMNVKRDLDKDA